VQLCCHVLHRWCPHTGPDGHIGKVKFYSFYKTRIENFVKRFFGDIRSMVGIAINSAAKLREIADACKDYNLPDNLLSYKNVYFSDNSRAGDGTVSNPIKMSQFAGKNVMYKSTDESVISVNAGYANTFMGWSSMKTSRHCNYHVSCAPHNGEAPAPIFDQYGNQKGAVSLNYQWWQQQGGKNLAITDDGNYVIYGLEIVFYIPSINANRTDTTFYICYRNSPNDSLNYFLNTYTSAVSNYITETGGALGDPISYNGLLYIPSRFKKQNNIQYCRLWVFDKNTLSYPHFIDFVGQAIQIADDTSRIAVTDRGTVWIYTYDGAATAATETTFTGGGEDIYIDGTCSTVLSGTDVWHRNGTSWSKADTSEIVSNQGNVFPFNRRISGDGLLIAVAVNKSYPSYGLNPNPRVFQYSPYKNKWYYLLEANNLSNLRDPYGLNLGLGFWGSIGISSGGKLFIQEDGYTNSPPDTLRTYISLKN
jgi:hypothetical protein